MFVLAIIFLHGYPAVHGRPHHDRPGALHRHGHRLERAGQGRHRVRRRPGGLQQRLPGALLQRLRLGLRHRAAAALRPARRRGRRHHRADRQERLHLPRHPVPRRHAHALPRAQVQGPRVVRAEVHPAHQPDHAHRPAVHHRRDVQPQGRPHRPAAARRGAHRHPAAHLLRGHVLRQLLPGRAGSAPTTPRRPRCPSPRPATTSSWPSPWRSPSSASTPARRSPR